MKLRYARNLQTCQCAIFPCPALFYLLSVCWKGRFLSSVFKVSVYVFLKIRTLNLYDRVGDSPPPPPMCGIFFCFFFIWPPWIIDQLKLFSNATCYCFLFVFFKPFCSWNGLTQTVDFLFFWLETPWNMLSLVFFFFLRTTLLFLFLFFTCHCNFIEFLNPLIHEND